MTRARILARMAAWWLWSVRALLLRMVAWGVIACPIGWAMGFAYATVFGAKSVVRTGLHEADGVAIRGGTLDLVANMVRHRTCPADTQRWLWRTRVIDGKAGTQWMPLPATVMPTLAADGPTMLTIPLPFQVESGDWKYRAVTTERCSWLPGPLGDHVEQSEDTPVRIMP